MLRMENASVIVQMQGGGRKQTQRCACFCEEPQDVAMYAKQRQRKNETMPGMPPALYAKTD